MNQIESLFKHTIEGIENKKIELITKSSLAAIDFECVYLTFSVARDLYKKSGTIPEFKKDVTNTFLSYNEFTDVKVYNKLRKFHTYSPFILKKDIAITHLENMLLSVLLPVYKPFALDYFKKNSYGLKTAARAYDYKNGTNFQDLTYEELTEIDLVSIVLHFLKTNVLLNAFAQTTKANCLLVYQGKIYNAEIVRSNRQAVEIQAAVIVEAITKGTLNLEADQSWNNQL